MIQSESYSFISGDDENLIQQLIEEGVLSSASLTRRVSQTRISIDASMDNPDALFELQVATGTQQDIPAALFDDMIMV